MTLYCRIMTAIFKVKIFSDIIKNNIVASDIEFFIFACLIFQFIFTTDVI